MGLFGKKKETAEAVDNTRKSKGLGRRILDLFSRDGGREDFFESLEDLLIEADMGSSVAVKLVDHLRETSREKGLKQEEDIIAELKSVLKEKVKSVELRPDPDRLNLFLILGVNGVGKTTTISKLGCYYRNQGFDGIIFSAGDTFRAAAVEQLHIHGERNGFRVVSQGHGADPGAVIFDSIASAKSRGDKLILADTAGRMHNRQDLVKELQKIDRVIKNNLDGGNYKKILIIDATTGQNGRQQAEVFHEAVGIDAVIMTKYDSTARGGLITAISMDPGLPFAYLGKGEKPSDFVPFDPDQYIEEILS